MTNPKLDAIIKRIRALRARAADAASTEAEAEIAARKAAQLLNEHNINLSEFDVRADGVHREKWNSGQRTQPVAALATFGIEAACNVRMFYQGGIVSIVGAPADVEVALYYLDLVKAACERCWSTFQRSGQFRALRDGGRSVHSLGFSFRKGVAIRIGERLKAMAAESQRAPESSTSRALVPVKDAMIQQWLHDQKIRLRSGKSTVSDGAGYHAGRDAGDRVSINRGLGSSRTDRLQLT